MTSRKKYALATLLILLGVLTVAAFNLWAGPQQDALVAVKDIEVGEKLTPSNTSKVRVEVGSIALVDSAEGFASQKLAQGTLIQPSDITGLDLGGQAVVGLALKQGQWPTVLRPGQEVLLVSSSQAVATSDAATTPTTTGGAWKATVLTQSADPAVVGAVILDVLVSPTDAGPVARAALSGEISVVGL